LIESKFPTQRSSAAENVALNKGYSSTIVAQVAVNGWINSPGHRRNLLTRNCSWCGIGVYQSSGGTWYLTQLFCG